jgi:hypothetical protein
MAAQRDQSAAERDQSAAECADHAERSIVGPRLNINKMVDHVWYCGGAKELDQFLDAL